MGFLEEILGQLGAKVLAKTDDALASVVVPRAVLSWVTTVSNIGYSGQLPGQKDSYFSVKKNEDNTYTGALKIEDELYTFENADLVHIAASVGVALKLDVPEISPDLKKKDLTALGRTIELLVKSEIINKGQKILAKKEAEVQEAPSSPVKVAPKTVKSSIPKLNPLLKLNKSEVSEPCKVCNKQHFDKMQFIGCLCLKGLAKSITSTPSKDGGVVLAFKNIDRETLEALVSILKN